MEMDWCVAISYKTIMAKDNACSTELLLTLCILMAYEVSSQHEYYKPLEHTVVIESSVREVPSAVTQFHPNEHYHFKCEHNINVNCRRSDKVVVFVWASDRETDAMRNCLYREMEGYGKRFSEYYWIKSYVKIPNLTVCERSMDLVTAVGKVNTTAVLVLSFYSPEIDRIIVKENKIGRRVVGQNDSVIIVSFVSQIVVLPPKIVSNYAQTIVCNSIQLRLRQKKTGQLRQRFFPVVGEPDKSQEGIFKATRMGSKNVTLDFDISLLNIPRLGMLNDSHTEIVTLTTVTVCCDNYDKKGLNNDSSGITDYNATKDHVLTTETLIYDGKVRLLVNYFIPVLFDNRFGTYSCITKWFFQTENRHNYIDEFSYVIHSFSIVLDDWRRQNIICKMSNYYCQKSNAELLNIRDSNEMLVLSIKVTSFILFFAILVCLIWWFIKTRSDQTVFSSIQSVLQSLESSESRTMKYDVFLSYSSKDRPWVKTTLLYFIESKGFKVCYDDRDFPYGCHLVEAIAEAVYDSRKVIAVVSPDYLSSRWCVMYEFVLTYTKILNKQASSNSLLLIK